MKLFLANTPTLCGAILLLLLVLFSVSNSFLPSESVKNEKGLLDRLKDTFSTGKEENTYRGATSKLFEGSSELGGAVKDDLETVKAHISSAYDRATGGADYKTMAKEAGTKLEQAKDVAEEKFHDATKKVQEAKEKVKDTLGQGESATKKDGETATKKDREGSATRKDRERSATKNDREESAANKDREENANEEAGTSGFFSGMRKAGSSIMDKIKGTKDEHTIFEERINNIKTSLEDVLSTSKKLETDANEAMKELEELQAAE